jgi:hypothetical protein
VYLRVNRLRAQLQDFPAHFRIETEGRPTLVMRDPVLRVGDFRRLSGLRPYRVEEVEDSVLELYLFQKLGDDAGKEGVDIPITFHGRDAMIQRIAFPQRFDYFMTPEIVANLFGGVEEADIDRGRREAGWASGGAEDEVSTRKDVVRMLGRPTREEKEDGDVRMIYEYRNQPRGSDPEPERADMALGYLLGGDEDRIRHVRIRIGRMHFNIQMPVDAEP